jgi:hypothetical protein
MSATPSTSNIANPSPGTARVDNKTPIRIMVVDDMRNMRMLVCVMMLSSVATAKKRWSSYLFIPAIW